MRWLLLLCASVIVARAERERIPGATENQVKAAFVYNFLKFVEWPSGCFGDAGAPIIIGVHGTGPMAETIAEAVHGRKVGSRPVMVRAVDTAEQADGAHVLFITAAEDAQLRGIEGALATGHLLTIGETDEFEKHGGIIRFVFEANKLRFGINMDAADRAGLQVNAQLQKLAIRVRRSL